MNVGHKTPQEPKLPTVAHARRHGSSVARFDVVFVLHSMPSSGGPALVPAGLGGILRVWDRARESLERDLSGTAERLKPMGYCSRWQASLLPSVSWFIWCI